MYTLTLDQGLSPTSDNDPSVKRLQQWKRAGVVQLLQAGPGARPSGPTPSPFRRAHAQRSPPFKATPSRSHAIRGSGDVTFRNLAAVLFPHRDSSKLRMGEINKVVHLIQHQTHSADIFVTRNVECYINDGHQKRLREAFGIIAMTPEQAVDRLEQAGVTAEDCEPKEESPSRPKNTLM